MTKIVSYSIKLNIAAMCCFLLPFFYTGCEKTTETEASSDTIAVDSIALDSDTLNDSTLLSTDSTNIKDTSLVDSVDTSIVSTKADSTAKSSKDDKDDLSLMITKKIPFLAPILVSKPSTYSGLAIIINTIPYLPLYSIVISFICLIISLIAKYIEPSSRRIILLLEIISFTTLAIARPASWNTEILWGFWIALAFVFSLVVCDLYIFKVISNVDSKEKGSH